MALDRLVNLELSMMNPFEADEAAEVAKHERAAVEQMPAADYDRLMLPRLVSDLSGKFVVVGKDGLRVVAVYEVPESFGREGSSIVIGKGRTVGTVGDFSYGGCNSCFSVVSNSQSQLITTAFFASFGSVLERLAFQIDAPVTHRMTVNHNVLGLFGETGYALVHVSQGLPFDVHVMEKTHQPLKHDLRGAEARIANIFHRVIAIYVHDIPINVGGVVRQTI